MKRRQSWRWLAAGATVLVALVWTRVGLAAPPRQAEPPGWTTPTQLAPDERPSLQSAPVLALAGDRTLLGWVDARNAAPDLYTAFWQGGQLIGAARATNLTPHFWMQSVYGAAVAIENSGRAFAVYTDGEQVYLVRYDPVLAHWSAPVQVTEGLTTWHAVARAPQLTTDGAGALVVVWEDFRNANPENDWADSKGSDIYAARCDGVAMTCGANMKINSDNTPGEQRHPRLSRRGAQVAIIWEDHRDYGAEAPQVYAALSNDGGATWGDNQRVSNPGATLTRRDSATKPVITFANDGALIAAWEHHAGAVTAPADIYAAWWQGAAWGAPQRVDAAPPRVRSLAPTLAAGDAGLFVAWQDYRAGASNPDIYAARWDGAGWREAPVSVAPGMQTQPALAAAGNRVHIAWQDARQGAPAIHTANWQGSAWSDGALAFPAAARTPPQMAPAMTSAGGATYAVFLDHRLGYRELMLSTLPFQATNWTPPSRLPTWANVGSDLSAEGADIVADSSGQLHAVWSEYVWPYGRHIHYSLYVGGAWRDPVRLSGAEEDGFERVAPRLATRNGVTAVVWTQRNNRGDVQLVATWNQGSGWSPPTPVLPATIAERWVLPASLALTNNQLLVTWDAWTGDGRGQVWLARRSLQGGNWSYTQVSPTIASDWCFQQEPQLRTDTAGVVHIVWSGCALRNPPDEWPHDSYIFYARSTDGGVTFSAPVRVGQTIASTDEEYHNNTDSRPALAVGANDDVMVLYPGRQEGSWTFYAALLQNGDVVHQERLGALTTNWTPPGEFDGRWYEGDSAGAVAYDAVRQRFIAAFPDRRNGEAPTLYTATFGGIDIAFTEQLYLPIVRR
ncbi:MAG TPA: hypothetical protein GX400_02975 [Chloroflexi bacterium]|nr:hypothetical protein [Chloroflexota bacterium]